jgi:hypothetical protein
VKTIENRVWESIESRLITAIAEHTHCQFVPTEDLLAILADGKTHEYGHTDIPALLLERSGHDDSVREMLLERLREPVGQSASLLQASLMVAPDELPAFLSTLQEQPSRFEHFGAIIEILLSNSMRDVVDDPASKQVLSIFLANNSLVRNAQLRDVLAIAIARLGTYWLDHFREVQGDRTPGEKKMIQAYVQAGTAMLENS